MWRNEVALADTVPLTARCVKFVLQISIMTRQSVQVISMSMRIVILSRSDIVNSQPTADSSDSLRYCRYLPNNTVQTGRVTCSQQIHKIKYCILKRDSVYFRRYMLTFWGILVLPFADPPSETSVNRRASSHCRWQLQRADSAVRPGQGGRPLHHGLLCPQHPPSRRVLGLLLARPQRSARQNYPG